MYDTHEKLWQTLTLVMYDTHEKDENTNTGYVRYTQKYDKH
jgi:hypothetical protein